MVRLVLIVDTWPSRMDVVLVARATRKLPQRIGGGSQTAMSPLYKRHGSADRELAALVASS